MNETSATEADQRSIKSLKIELVILSVVSLFAELLFIRWLSADVRAFGTFRTFPLVACYVGMGVGYALGKDRFFRLAPIMLMLSVSMIKILEFAGLSMIPFPSISVTTWGEISAGDSQWLVIVVLAQILLLMLVGPCAFMVCLGERLGVLFGKMPPLTAYAINISGAILGSILFGALTFAGLSPVWQLALVLLVLFFYAGVKQGKAIITAIVSIVAIVIGLQAMPVAPGAVTIWSPYQRLDLVPMTFGNKEAIGYHLLSNRLPYQSAADFSEANLKSMEGQNEKRAYFLEMIRRYETPYRLFPGEPEDVLVVGAGMGNDLTTAIRCHAHSVDAVELDPSILNLGRTKNPAHPYDSPVIHPFCDDARHFFNQTTKKYDLIIFSHLDSGYVIGQGSSCRIDNYVYTRESLQRALSLLKPHGLLVLSYYTVRNWFNDRLLLTTIAAAGYKPIAFCDIRDKQYANTYFVMGPDVANGSFHLPQSIAPYATTPPHDNAPARVLTDDWPFLYVTPGILDLPYLFVVAETLLIAAFLGRNFLIGKRQPGSAQMFFLGAAFLLLELQAISRLARLFGSTWLTSSLVINGVLVMILLANLVVMKNTKWLSDKNKLLYPALGLALCISFMMPINQVLGLPGMGYFTVTFLTVLPMFFAALIFSTAFSKVKHAGYALGFNLFGSIVGAMLEYLSNYIGINNLVLLALLLYACSWAVTLRRTPPSGESAPP
jgi:SAM-dependent methyltransferase